MINERDSDIVQIEVEAFIEQMLKEYLSAWLGDRGIGEVQNGEIYSEEGRFPDNNSQENGGELLDITGR